MKVLTKSQIKELYWKYCFNEDEFYKFLIKVMPENIQKELSKNKILSKDSDFQYIIEKDDTSTDNQDKTKIIIKVGAEFLINR